MALSRELFRCKTYTEAQVPLICPEDTVSKSQHVGQPTGLCFVLFYLGMGVARGPMSDIITIVKSRFNIVMILRYVKYCNIIYCDFLKIFFKL